MDNLDRIAPIYDERSGRSNHEEIFIDRSEQLKALDCHIIYTIPLPMLFSKWANELNRIYNDSKILPMIMVRSPDGKIHAPGVATIKQILARRIQHFAAALDLETEIFESAATLERLCLMSGGHVRGLLRLAQEAVNRTDTLPISAKAVQRAITEERDSYRRTIEEHWWPLLAEVFRTKQIQHDMTHRSLFFNLCLLEYSYLDEQGEKHTWYDVNPLLIEFSDFQAALSTIDDHVGENSIDPTILSGLKQVLGSYEDFLKKQEYSKVSKAAYEAYVWLNRTAEGLDRRSAVYGRVIALAEYWRLLGNLYTIRGSYNADE